MQFHTKFPKEVAVPMVDIPSDLPERCDGQEGGVPAFAFIPIEFIPLADADISTKFSEQYTLVKNRDPDNQEVRLRPRLGRQLMAILIADIVGYCRLMHADEAGTVKCLNAYKNMISAEIDNHKGVLVDACGDNLMAAFMSAVDAVRCAVTIQKRIEKENQGLLEAEQMNFRMGLHLGDVINQGPCLYGNTINIAARLQGISDPGGIRISRAVYEQVVHTLDLPFYNLGERHVKNIPHPVVVYRVGDK